MLALILSELLNQFGHQSGPSGLMAGSNARAIVSVEVFKVEHQLLEYAFEKLTVSLAMHLLFNLIWAQGKARCGYL
jgi:hypothetical protein